MVTLRHGTMSMPDGSLVEPWRNMAKRMAGFLEKPTILSTVFFDLGINTLSNIATKLSCSDFGTAVRGSMSMCSVAQTPMTLPVVSTVMAGTTTATVTVVGEATTTKGRRRRRQ